MTELSKDHPGAALTPANPPIEIKGINGPPTEMNGKNIVTKFTHIPGSILKLGIVNKEDDVIAVLAEVKAEPTEAVTGIADTIGINNELYIEGIANEIDEV